ncbi:UPF0082 protein C8D2.12c [Termitomyces sp. T112]|nr:UPF0082 protein C8D2.12c [Termitomyces sp. T112]KAH0584266.1 hypothetical protein H2248_009815 [Termitomyces sp. 'cryptogamus']
MIKSGLLVLPTRRTFSSCRVALAGHNKWSKIKQKKGANDAQKSVIFGKAARDIVLAARQGGSTDPLKNVQLATVLKRAKDMNVPKENIEKALAKASRGKEGGDTFVYEVLAFNHVGLIIECATDNSNRTIHTLREILNNYGARQAPVKFMFKRVGYVVVSPVDGVDQTGQEDLVETALTHGAIDFDNIADSSGHSVWFTSEPDALISLSTAIINKFSQKWNVDVSELRYIPLEDSPEVSEEAKNDLKALIEELENNEDVLQVWTSLQDDH